MDSTRSAEMERWAEEARWVRSLALSLVADAEDADDLVQDAWIAALERTRRPDVPWRRWVAAVMRNLSRTRWRGAQRRLERERDTALEERIEPESLVLERLEVHERVVAAVRALEEPYRAAILMRYFEGLGPAAIARRTGAPLATVHTRLQRGLAALRERLGREDRRWRGALALLLLPAAPEGRAVAGPAGVTGALPWIVAAVAGGALALGLAVSAVSKSFPSPAAATSVPQPRSEEARGVRAEPARLASRESARVGGDSPPAASATLEPPRLHGEVLDARGAALAGVGVAFAPHDGSAEQRATSDSGGRFELPRPGADGLLRVEDERFAPLLASRFLWAGEERAHVLVAAPRAPLAGTVVDARGRPCGGARIALLPPANLRAGLERVLDATVAAEQRTAADERGRFELPDAFGLAGARLVTELDGHEPDERSAPESGDLALWIELRPVAERITRIRGAVVGEDGAQVAGALVALGAATTRCDDTGHFEFDLERLSEEPQRSWLAQGPRALRALAPGRLPAQLVCGAESFDAPDAWPAPPEGIVLRLGGEPLVIAGRVVDSAGRPVPGALVEVLDREPFGVVELPLGEHVYPQMLGVEALLSADPWDPRVRADAAGAFRVGGLQHRTYRLRAVDPRTLDYGETPELAAGSAAVEVALPAGERRERVAGRVLGRDGAPVPGAFVHLERHEPPWEPGAALGALAFEGERVCADGDGRFELRGVAREADVIAASTPGVPGVLRHALADFASPDDVVLVVARACHVQVDLTGTDLVADGFQALDAAGRPLLLLLEHGEAGMVAERFPLAGGRSEAVGLADTAVAMALYLAEEEVLRIPITLVPGTLTVVRP